MSEPLAQPKVGVKKEKRNVGNGGRKGPKGPGGASPHLRSASALGPEKGAAKRTGTINKYFLPVSSPDGNPI
jgi:hypothetical protein